MYNVIAPQGVCVFIKHTKAVVISLNFKKLSNYFKSIKHKFDKLGQLYLIILS